MLSAQRHLTRIIAQIVDRGGVLMLDFDGVLSPIVADPRDARLSPSARKSLRALVKHIPIAVITGRTLANIEHRVNISELSYAGSHGYEWRFAKSRGRVEIPARTLRSFQEARTRLRRIATAFGIHTERKSTGFTLLYRGLSRGERAKLRKAARAAIKDSFGLRVFDYLFCFEIMPDTKHSKGTVAQECYKRLAPDKKTIPVYIGDGMTDEDAFRCLKKGVTIRVGKNARSAAHYYFAQRSEVDSFLKHLLDALEERRLRDLI